MFDKRLNVLSLFDGMGCGWIALKELGINVNHGYASEVDKFAISQTTYNFPDIVHLGSVTEVDVSKLEPIDLLIGGSPCQCLSFAGKRAGLSTVDKEEITTLERYLELKEGGFQFEGQSYLFWEYMRILNDIRKYNPNVMFLLENVEMGKKWEEVFNEAIGLKGVHINAALVSAQNRRRIYWTNIGLKNSNELQIPYSNIPQPKDRSILMKNILEDKVDEKYYLSYKSVESLFRKNDTENVFPHKLKLVEKLPEQSCETADDSLSYLKFERYVVTVSKQDGITFQKDGKTQCLTAGYYKGPITTFGDRASVMEVYEPDTQDPQDTRKCRIRKFTPTECARLQSIPNWYVWKGMFPDGKVRDTSDTQIYKMCGNGWNVEVIKHIFSFI